MNLELARRHAQLSRRDALKLGAAGVAGAATLAGLPTSAGAAVASPHDRDNMKGRGDGSGRRRRDVRYDDTMFDIEAAIAGAWAPSRYGAGDERGTFNELTPERTAKALRLLDARKPVNTYQMGEEMFNGFPAFPSDPPRRHDMFLFAFGFTAPQDFVDNGGIQSGTEPFGLNKLTGFEERFRENFTFQIATQIDGLNHIGVGTTYYNGFQALEILSPTGTTALGNETMGPVVTRGVILDIVGLKVASGATDAYFTHDGKHILNDHYRVTIDDIENALRRQRIGKGFGPGDVPIIHTGWTHLARTDPDRYLSAQPGIYLAEARYFADKRVALVATDTWGLEVLDPTLTQGNAFPVHHVLITQHGVRIGESFVSDTAIADHAYEGVLVATPENVPGATCGSTPPVFMAQPGRSPRK